MPTYISYKGSPDVFEQETGKYISFEEAQKLGNVFGNVKQSDALRPGVTQESDFASLSQTNLPSYNPIASPQNQPSPEAQKLFSQGAVPISKTPQEIQREQENTATRKRFLDIQEQFLASLTPSPEQQQLQEDFLAKRREQTGALIGAQEDIAGIEGRPSTMGFIQGATGARQKQYELQKMRIALEMQPMVDRLNTLSAQQGNIAEKAKLALQLQQATQPDVLKTEINADTGEVVAIERDPFSGEITSNIIGHITPKAAGTEYVSTSQEIAADGSKIFTGITKDGKVVRETIAPAGTFKVSGEGGLGLTPYQQITAKNSVVDDFRSDPAVQQYTTAAAGWSSLSNIDVNNKTSADDIAAIYAFAKIMDPNSVVREGEYATVQKYAQSWLQNFGFNANRILQNKEFLAPSAVKNLQQAAKARMQPLENAYNNARQTYQGRLTELGAGASYLPDYGYTPVGQSPVDEYIDKNVVTNQPTTEQTQESTSWWGSIGSYLFGK